MKREQEVKMEPGEESSLECGFCGEELTNQEEMVSDMLPYYPTLLTSFMFGL